MLCCFGAKPTSSPKVADVADTELSAQPKHAPLTTAFPVTANDALPLKLSPLTLAPDSPDASLKSAPVSVNAIQLPAISAAPRVIALQPKTFDKPVSNGVFKLFWHGYSPIAEQVRIALALKNIKVDLTSWSSDETPPPWFAGTSPVFQLLDGTLTSNVSEIFDILEAHKPIPSLDRAKATDLVAVIQRDLLPSFDRLLLSIDQNEQMTARSKFNAAVNFISGELTSSTGPFLLGSAVTEADVIVAPILRQFPLLTYFRDATFRVSDSLASYVQTLESQHFVQQVVVPLAQLKALYVSTLPKQGPLSLVRLQHVAIRYHLDRSTSQATTILHGSNQAQTLAKGLQQRLMLLVALLRAHGAFEDEVLFLEFEKIKFGCTKGTHDEYERKLLKLESFERVVQQIVGSVAKGQLKKPAKSDEFKAFVESLRNLGNSEKFHMAGEEADLLTLISGQGEAAVVRSIHFNFKPVNEELLPYILEALSPADRAQYIH
ncbi:hypothetical protein BC830DRAFT_1221293, partial [Chytriomyces sp. MP71]